MKTYIWNWEQWSWENLLQADKQYSIWNEYEEYEKYIDIKLVTTNRRVLRKSIANPYEENKSNNEIAILFTILYKQL